jgi:hypothetical protein
MKKFYVSSLGIIFLLSFYPLAMGVQILTAYISHGYIDAADYPKYVIPYTPIAIALIVSVAALPLAVKLCNKFALSVVSILGVGLFLLFEIIFESVTVFSVKEGIADIGSWQMYLCVAPMQVIETVEFRETIGQALSERYSPLFKVHFYLISILIVLTVLGVVYGFSKMIRENNYIKIKPLIIQTAAVAVFVALCIFACFTAFYRTGDINISALSAWLMSVFFIMFGITAGTYSGSLLYFKKPVFSRFIPSLIASAATVLMYVGELFLMDGELFKFGRGFFFQPFAMLPFAPVDYAVIAASGVITYLILLYVKEKKHERGRQTNRNHYNVV